MSANHSTNCGKSLLYISYLFPPISNGGVQRPLQQVRELARLGWDITVIAGSGYRPGANQDSALLREIPTGVKVIRLRPENTIGITRPTQFDQCRSPISVLKSVGGRLCFDLLHVFPDREFFWALRILVKVLAKGSLRKEVAKANLIYASIMPFSSGVIAYFLSLLFRKPYTLEYRDLFLKNPNFRKPLIPTKICIDALWEKLIAGRASKIVVVTPTMGDYFADKGLSRENKVVVVPNGYEPFGPKDEAGGKQNTTELTRPTTIIRYTGRLYESQRIDGLIEALGTLVASEKVSPSMLSFEFYGPPVPEIHHELIRSSGLAEYFVHKGYVDYERVKHLQETADALLLIEPAKGVYTTKVFEYLRTRKPIIALVSSGSDLYHLLKSAGYEHVVQWNRDTEIRDALSRIASKTSVNGQNKLDATVIDSFARDRLVLKLHHHLLSIFQLPQ